MIYWLKSVDEILNDFVYLTSTLYILQTAIQALIDMGERVISELGEKPPTVYREVAQILKNLGILNGGESDLMVKIIGFRNVVVQGCVEVSC